MPVTLGSTTPARSRLDAVAAGDDRRDLRRTAAERLLDAADHLPPADRLLLRHVYDRGAPITELARATGVCPRSLQKRVARLVRRTREPLFRFLCAHGDTLPPDTRRLAALVAHRGLSQRAAARHAGVSLHTLRGALRDARTLARTWGFA